MPPSQPSLTSQLLSAFFQGVLSLKQSSLIQEKKLVRLLALLVWMVELVLGPLRPLVLAPPLGLLLTAALPVFLLLPRVLFRMY